MPPIGSPTGASLNTVDITLNSSTTTTPAETLMSDPSSVTAEKRAAPESDIVVPPAKHAHVEPTTLNFVNSVTPAVGATFVIPKATRKKRSDAGVARGPQKQQTPHTSENAPPAETTSSVVASKPRPRKKAAMQVAAEVDGSSSSSV